MDALTPKTIRNSRWSRDPKLTKSGKPIIARLTEDDIVIFKLLGRYRYLPSDFIAVLAGRSLPHCKPGSKFFAESQTAISTGRISREKTPTRMLAASSTHSNDDRRDGATPPREAGPRRSRTPSYLVRRRGVFFFHVRPPKALAAFRFQLDPIRVRLGVLARREAQRRAMTLGALAYDAFDDWRRHMEMEMQTGERDHRCRQWPRH